MRRQRAATSVAILVVIIAVIVMKALFGRGRPMHGGMPSGHAAVAFAVATAVSLNTADPLVSVLTLGLAGMVSHSRLLLRIHTVGEVIAGAVTGVILTAAVMFFFRAVQP